MKIGDKVYFGRRQGERTLGEIVKVNPKRLKVRQLESRGTMRAYAVGTVWTVPPSLCTPAEEGSAARPLPAAPSRPKRPDAEILYEIAGIDSSLSPENLHCDGEISRSAAARRGAVLRRRLRECLAEIGRPVDFSEAYAVWETERAESLKKRLA